MLSGRLLLLLALLFAELSNAQSQEIHKPLKRKDSFFGLHFDFHAVTDDQHIGRTLTYGMIDSLLTEVRPDFIQVDCKGHPGISSYPTKVGTAATSFDKDPLRLWREVTRRHGVALYVHYSGVYDKQALKLHPDWAAMNSKGSMSSDNTSVFGPYADQLLIPQLKELSREYGIDGVWVDGDCWATVPDYGAAALKAFREQTGANKAPHQPVSNEYDSLYGQWMNFHRQAFLNYVQHYTSVMHSFNPDFQVASNWAFSSFIPRPVSVDVDFLSGDLTPVNSLNNAAFEGRCLASQAQAYNKPWDIMSWSFTLNWETGLQTKKSAAQLEQEAAEIISMGGGFQCYFTQNRDASIKPWQIPTMAGLSSFVQARRKFCKGAIPVPQIAVLYSGAAHERRTREVFSNGGLERMMGITTALLDGQQAVEIKMEHHLHGKMNQYPLIVVPEWDWLPDPFRDELLQYVAGGGKLLVIGAKATRLFAKEAGLRLYGNGDQTGLHSRGTGMETDIRLSGAKATAAAGDSIAATATGDPTLPTTDTVQKNKLQYLGYQGILAGIRGDYQPTTLLPGTRAFGTLHDQQDFRFDTRPAASIASYGKGQIACIPEDMGLNYDHNGSFQQRNFLNDLVKELFASPVVTVFGSHLVHVAVDRLDSLTVIHLINTAGQHAVKETFSYDEVPALGPLLIRIRMKKPARLTLQPENQPIPFTYTKGEVVLRLPGLKIHSMLVVSH